MPQKAYIAPAKRGLNYAPSARYALHANGQFCQSILAVQAYLLGHSRTPPRRLALNLMPRARIWLDTAGTAAQYDAAQDLANALMDLECHGAGLRERGRAVAACNALLRAMGEGR